MEHNKRALMGRLSDDTEMDAYFDFSQELASPSRASANNFLADGSPIDLNAMFAPEHIEDTQSFAHPSHEYGRFPQQTGLPSGSVSSLAAFNGPTDRMRSSSFTTFGTPDFDSSLAGYNSGFALDGDFEMNVNMPTHQYNEDPINESVNPSEINTPLFPSTSDNFSRHWVGIHSQRAEQVKAMTSANKHQQQKQGQRLMQQKQQQQQQQQPQQNSSQHVNVREEKSRVQPVTDSVVEERISRLLGQMRHGSNASSNLNDDENSPEPGDSSRTGRSRKDEEDMDEDERLLASEEGKKLSSKERRQLRNKVSARAFRSRRKEYISQLEGEVAAKNNECNQLRSRNRHLVVQNEQLTQLTRKLLAHPAFNNFLEDMANDPSILAPPPTKSLPSSQEPLPSSEVKTEEMSQSILPSNDMDVHMTSTANNQNLGFQMLNLENDPWSANHHAMHFQQPQVFSVLSVPEPSVLELLSSSTLSGKSPKVESEEQSPVMKAKDMPRIERVVSSYVSPSRVEQHSAVESVGGSLSDVDYPLYAVSSPSPSGVAQDKTQSLDRIARLLEALPTAKSVSHFVLTASDCTDPDTAIKNIDKMFDSLQPSLETILRLTGTA